MAPLESGPGTRVGAGVGEGGAGVGEGAVVAAGAGALVGWAGAAVGVLGAALVGAAAACGAGVGPPHPALRARSKRAKRGMSEVIRERDTVIPPVILS